MYGDRTSARAQNWHQGPQNRVIALSYRALSLLLLTLVYISLLYYPVLQGTIHSTFVLVRMDVC